jgi:VWFA-related protein
MMRARVGLVGLLGVFGLLHGAATVRSAASVPQQTQTTTAPPATQGAQGADPQATFRARVDSVFVDVQVTDKQGKPVTDLKQTDFEVRESKKPQTIETFKYIQVDDTPVDPEIVPEILSLDDQQREAAKEDVRITVIYLDDYHTHLSSSMRIRAPLSNWVRSQNPRDLFAIATPLMPTALLTFSHNLNGIASEIQHFIGRKYDYTPKFPVESQISFLSPQEVEQTRNSIVISSLDALCALLGTFRDGRKTLVYVSEGLTGDIMNTSLGGSKSASLSTNAMLASENLYHDLEITFQSASRSNTSIYTLDPRGLAASAYEPADTFSARVSQEQDHQTLGQEIDSLRIIADQTGGRAIVGSNDPLPALKQMMRDSSGYYLLSYTSTEKPRDGKFHPISVQVNRKDVEFRARKGYWAYSSDAVARMTSPAKPRASAAVTEALDSVEEPKGDRAVRVWAGAVRGPSGKDTVTVSWEATPGRGSGPKDEPVDHVAVTGRSVYGEEVFNGTITRDDKQTTPAGSVKFDAPPGNVRLKVVAVSASGQRLDTIERDVDVPDFTAPAAVITTPAVFRGRTPRELQQIRAAAQPVPTPTREFSRTERLLLRFEAYALGGLRPKVTMRLLNQIGQPMTDLAPPTPVGDNGYEVEIGLGSLAPGSYVIEIDADAGGGQTQSLVAIKVTG